MPTANSIRNQVRKLASTGLNAGQIAAKLNDDGQKTVRGKKFTAWNVRDYAKSTTSAKVATKTATRRTVAPRTTEDTVTATATTTEDATTDLIGIVRKLVGTELSNAELGETVRALVQH